MKRLIAAVLCIWMLFVLSSCKKEQSYNKDKAVYSKSNVSLTAEQLTEINNLRPDYDLGVLRKLEGDIAVVLYFMSDDVSNWDGASIEDFVKYEIQPGLDFLEKEADSYRIRLKFEIVEKSLRRYNGEVNGDPNDEYVTSDLLDDIADDFRLKSDNELYESLKNKYGGREVICITVFNKNGCSMGINPQRGSEFVDDIVEHCIIFTHDFTSDHTEQTGSQASLVACNILYLYGAENLNKPDDRELIAAEEYPWDVMLYNSYDISENEIEAATAFYIGWLNEAPDVFYEDGWRQ